MSGTFIRRLLGASAALIFALAGLVSIMFHDLEVAVTLIAVGLACLAVVLTYPFELIDVVVKATRDRHDPDPNVTDSEGTGGE